MGNEPWLTPHPRPFTIYYSLLTSLSPDRFHQRRTEPRRRGRNLDARSFHRRDLVFGATLAARDHGTRMTHGAPGRSGAPGNETCHRLAAAALCLVADELG